MKVWIDQDGCTGVGLCADAAPQVFHIDADGIAWVKQDGVVLGPDAESRTATVPDELADAVIDAAEGCPTGCIYVEA
jgi:ferredoxin